MLHAFYAVSNVNEREYLVRLYVDEFISKTGNIYWAYNLNSIRITPIAASQVYSPAYTKGVKSANETSTTFSICDLFKLVNTYYKNLSYNLVSKYVLNADGTPKLFKHQTEGSFYVFDTRREGAGAGLKVV